MKKKLLKILGIVLCLPFPISIIISVAGMVAHKSNYERWLFEDILFPMLDWAIGSYFKAIVLWFGLVIGLLLYIRLIVFCYFYETPQSRYEQQRKEQVNRWLNA